MRFLQEAAITFVHKLEDVDTALVVQFNESIKGSAEFTGDVDAAGAVRGGAAGLGRHQPLRRHPLRPQPHPGPAGPQGA